MVRQIISSLGATLKSIINFITNTKFRLVNKCWTPQPLAVNELPPKHYIIIELGCFSTSSEFVKTCLLYSTTMSSNPNRAAFHKKRLFLWSTWLYYVCSSCMCIYVALTYYTIIIMWWYSLKRYMEFESTILTPFFIIWWGICRQFFSIWHHNAYFVLTALAFVGCCLATKVLLIIILSATACM